MFNKKFMEMSNAKQNKKRVYQSINLREYVCFVNFWNY